MGRSTKNYQFDFSCLFVPTFYLRPSSFACFYPQLYPHKQPNHPTRPFANSKLIKSRFTNFIELRNVDRQFLWHTTFGMFGRVCVDGCSPALVGFKATCCTLTEHLTILELQNLTVDNFCLVRKRRSPAFEDLKLWHVQSGRCCYVYSYIVVSVDY